MNKLGLVIEETNLRKRLAMILALLVMVAVICLFSTFARSEEPTPADLQRLELQYQVKDWEYRYLQERAKTLQFEAQELATKIDAMKKELAKKDQKDKKQEKKSQEEKK